MHSTPANQLQGGQLLAGLHQPDLGSQRGACAAGEQQRRDHRAEFAHQRQVDDQPQALGGPVAHQRVVHLQREHEADRQARRQDDDQRAVADRVHLLDDQQHPAQRRRQCPQELEAEERGVPPAAQFAERRGAQAREAVGHRAHRAATPKSAPISGAG